MHRVSSATPMHTLVRDLASKHRQMAASNDKAAALDLNSASSIYRIPPSKLLFPISSQAKE